MLVVYEFESLYIMYRYILYIIPFVSRCLYIQYISISTKEFLNHYTRTPVANPCLNVSFFLKYTYIYVNPIF